MLVVDASSVTKAEETTLDLSSTSSEKGEPIGFEVTEKRFTFHPHFNRLSQFDDSAWTPTRPLNASGIMGTLHGELAPEYSCDVTTHCQGKNCFSENPSSHDAYALMGLENATTWVSQCPSTGESGESALAISNVSTNERLGIGFYTHTGDSFSGSSPAFYQPWQTRPTSEGLQAAYVNIPAHLNGQMKPFSGDCSGTDCDERVQLRVWGKQSVQTADTPAGTQAQQKLAFVLENSADPSGEFVEYTPYTFCSGVFCSVSNNAHYNFDPNQGGTAYVGGRLMGGGQPTIMTVGSESTVVWESYNISTFSEPFDVQWFHYQISWKNFKNTLRLFTTYAGSNGTNDADVAALFGNGWDVRTNWQLRQARFGQEVYNPNWETTTAYVGGFTSWYQIDALPLVPTSINMNLVEIEPSRPIVAFVLILLMLGTSTLYLRHTKTTK